MAAVLAAMKRTYLSMLSGVMIVTATTLFPATSQAEDTPLAKEMDEMSGALKGLRKAKTYADKVKLVQEAQAATLKSAAYAPMIFADISDEKAKALAWADYKRLIGVTYTKLSELEQAYLEENDERASELRRELKQIKKEAHRKYTE